MHVLCSLITPHILHLLGGHIFDAKCIPYQYTVWAICKFQRLNGQIKARYKSKIESKYVSTRIPQSCHLLNFEYFYDLFHGSMVYQRARRYTLKIEYTASVYPSFMMNILVFQQLIQAKPTSQFTWAIMDLGSLAMTCVVPIYWTFP